MEKDSARYLSHLNGALPKHAHGYMSSGYSIALEGWRRGLNLKIKVAARRGNRVVEYILDDGEKSYYFQDTRGDLVSRDAVHTCVHKDLTKKALLKAGVATPRGETFDEEKTVEEILTYAQELGYPLVVKPSNGTGGKGVIANIRDESEMKEAIDYVRNNLKFNKIIVEQFFKGEDHRFYVVGNEVIGIFKRDPASVTGNGKDTIENLLRKKNEARMKIPSLKNKPIKVNKETETLLNRVGYTLSSVPADGEVVFLKSKNNVSSGGEAVDVTDEISKEFKEIAVSAAKAIPTLIQAGVDMIIDKEKNLGVILEINSRPHIRTHLFPSYGRARDIPTAVIDYYFPATKGYDRTNRAQMYFDFDHVFESFLSGVSEYIEIPNIPDNIKLARLEINTNNNTTFSDTINDWIQRRARKNKVSGYLKKVNKNTFSLVCAGSGSEVDEFKKIVSQKISKSMSIVQIRTKSRTTPVKQGFVIIKGEENNKHLQLKNDKLREENIKLKKDLKLYKKQLKQMRNSTSWKLTKPLRVIKNRAKK
ncbi:ATP-grasp domain-containing protein [Bacillus sp. A301a_S52]|jgi:D-alanine-D-alanine ligase-like ATP-grasp enzyme/acylphosphatase|nr:ATP-grasp domain-containing protein [Bacillus sp. A301a_S52]